MLARAGGWLVVPPAAPRRSRLRSRCSPAGPHDRDHAQNQHEELELAAARWLALRHRHTWPAVGRRTGCMSERAGCALDRSVRLWRDSSRERSHVWGSCWLGLVGRQRGSMQGTRRHRTGVGASQCTQLADCSPAASNAPHAPATGPQTWPCDAAKAPTLAALHLNAA